MPRLTTILLCILLLGVSSTLSSVEKNLELGAQSLVSSEGKELGDQSLVKRCLVDEPVPERKFLTHNSEKQVITLLGSQRIASRLLASIFSIFANEVLGYNVAVAPIVEGFDSLDPQTQFARLSSCEQQYCTDLDTRMAPAELRVPEAMIALDLWLPAVQEVEAWGLLDAGQLGPATRFGWFIPSHGSSAPSRTHWRQFSNSQLIKPFILSDDQNRYIEEHIKPPGGSHYCRPPLCSNGMFTPTGCTAQKCATIVADFPSTSSLYNSTLLTEFIRAENLLVRVAFVGPYLEQVVARLNFSTKGTDKSFVLLHYHPSTLTVRFSLIPILFPLCPEPLVDGRQEQHECLYTPNRLAKVAWKPIQNKAPDLWKFLDAFNFRYAEYVSLLEHYNTEANMSMKSMTMENRMKNGELDGETNLEVKMDEIACSWLLHNHTLAGGFVEPWYKQFPGGDQNQKPLLYIGGIFPISASTKFTAPELVPVAIMAMNEINNSPSILPGHRLMLEIHNGACEPDIVMKKFIDFIKNKDPTRFRSTIGILGPACSDTVEPIAGVSKHFKTVVISYSAEGSISNSKSQADFPYFFRTIAENKQYKHAYLAAFSRFGWSQVATLTQEGQKYSHYITQLQDELQHAGVTFINNRKFPREATDMSQYLRDLRDRGAKVIIGDFYEEAARHIMCQAYSLGMTQAKGYVWFLPGWFKDRWFDIDYLREKKKESGEQVDEVSLPANCTTAKMLAALDGAFCLMHNNYGKDSSLTVGNVTVTQWREKLKGVLEIFYENYKRQGDQTKNFVFHPGPNKYSGYVYDAVWLYARVLDALIRKDKSLVQDLHSDETMDEFVAELKKQDFMGVSGRVNFHSGHSRLSEIRIMQWSLESDTKGKQQMNVNQIGLYKPKYDNKTESSLEWFDWRLRWKTEDGLKPSDRDRRCGVLSPFAVMMDLECQLTITITFLLGFGSFMVVLLSLFAGLKIRYERRMAATEKRMRELGLLHSPLSVLALDDWEMPRDRVVMNRKLGEGAFGMVYGGESFFDEKGWVAVAVKTLKTGSSVEEKVNFLSEADMMKRFEHRNIVRLLGVCTRSEPVYTVMEYMLYGDLKTYLLARRHLVNERNREELDEVSNKRLTCMALDIAAGLSYLAEQKYVHRDIACRNCLINSSRTVKLADFGMTRPMFESDYYRFSRKGMLPVRWMAPESLADGLFTPMSDIWSYGVLLYEIITFGSFPFQGLSNNQVLETVKSGTTLSIPSGTKPQLSTLLTSCWNRSPTKRPTAAEIAELLYNNPRLVSPCIDVPLASVQVERSDSLEMLIGRAETREDESLLRPAACSPMAPQWRAGEGEGLLRPVAVCSPMLGDTYSPMTEMTDLSADSRSDRLESLSSYVQPGYIFMERE